jgi:hypothetical protein
MDRVTARFGEESLRPASLLPPRARRRRGSGEGPLPSA